jgi:hypothetical protein
MKTLPELLPPRKGLTREQWRRLTILRGCAVALGLMPERDARYHHDDEIALNGEAWETWDEAEDRTL